MGATFMSSAPATTACAAPSAARANNRPVQRRRPGDPPCGAQSPLTRSELAPYGATLVPPLLMLIGAADTILRRLGAAALAPTADLGIGAAAQALALQRTQCGFPGLPAQCCRRRCLSDSRVVVLRHGRIAGFCPRQG
jgi:hypothetical protein